MDMNDLDGLTHEEMVGELQAQLKQQAREFVETVTKAVLAERQACASDVCFLCAGGQAIIDAPNGLYHRLVDDGGEPFLIVCRAAPIHARAQAQAKKESGHE